MKILLTEEQLQDGVQRLAKQITAKYEMRPLTILGVLTGSVVLLADVIRLLSMPLRVGVVQASSYRGEMVRGKLVVNADLMPDISDREVLLLDDIFDTGFTMLELLTSMAKFNPRSISTAVLLRKEGRCQVDFTPDFAAFDIPDEFVVGYGLDYRDQYRNLPYVAALEPADLDD